MKDIKYQAWDTKDKRMVSWRELLDYRGGLTEYFENPRELIFREYTGLKDKNGEKEAYEKDIVESFGGVRGVIEFIEGQFVIDFTQDKRPGYKGNMIYSIKERVEWGKGYLRDKIIGNIYENGDLLNGQ